MAPFPSGRGVKVTFLSVDGVGVRRLKELSIAPSIAGVLRFGVTGESAIRDPRRALGTVRGVTEAEDMLE